MNKIFMRSTATQFRMPQWRKLQKQNSQGPTSPQGPRSQQPRVYWLFTFFILALLAGPTSHASTLEADSDQSVSENQISNVDSVDLASIPEPTEGQPVTTFAATLPNSEIEAGLGVLAPQGSYKVSPLSVSLAYLFPASDRMYWGPLVRLASGDASESGDFSNTGTSETRSYRVSSYFIGAQGKTRISSTSSLAIHGGLSLSQSVFQQNQSTQTPSSAIPNGTPSSTTGVAYGLSLRFEYPFLGSSLGAELGYMLSTSSTMTADRGAYLGLIYTFGGDQQDTLSYSGELTHSSTPEFQSAEY